MLLSFRQVTIKSTMLINTTYIFYFWFGLRKLEGLKIREYNQRNDRMAGYADSLEEELDALVYSIENKQNDVGSYT
jgi:hypothetical protein